MADHDATEDLLLIDEPVDGVRRFTLNRPDKRNALSPALRHALLDGLAAADADETARVAVVRGAGVCFSAGYDIKAGVSDPTLDADADGTMPNWATIATHSWLRITDMDLPVIAQIHGMALAGGVELAAACDLVYIAHDARLGHPVTPLFGPPDFNFSPWLVGPRHSMEMMLTGELMSGDEAVRIGFANRAVDAGALDDYVLERAALIAKSPRNVSRTNKRTVRAGMETMGVRDTILAMIEHRAAANELTNVAGTGAGVFDAVKKTVTPD